jgi:hypothetical protein
MHKAHGAPGIYYEMFPDEQPTRSLKFFEDREHDLGRDH